jgi:hypothetical protein
MNAIEAERLRFRPDRIRTLFVGESAPLSGDFFYFGGTNMTCFMRKVLAPEATSDLDFLDGFKARGWYLDDLVLIPVNGMTPRERRAHRLRSQSSLAARIAEYQPLAIVTLLRGIRKVVEDAARDAGSKADLHGVPFPGNSHQNRFLEEMAQLLPRLP